jgi:hypothetical protein
MVDEVLVHILPSIEHLILSTICMNWLYMFQVNKISTYANLRLPKPIVAVLLL